MKRSILFLVLLIFCSCKNDEIRIEGSSLDRNETLFSEILSKTSNVTFGNVLNETFELNFLNYPYIYIGGGVAVGDINNDGLQDLYFTSNQNSNKLYLNKGGFEFEDITSKSGASDQVGWSTGTSMIDINNDGWLDIYVCKAASLDNHDLRRNKLYINQKDNTFIESAKSYGLDHPGFSTQSYFLDYDMDGDLDMYLVSHRPDFNNNTKISTQIQNEIYEISSDQLFRNEGDTFVKVSQEAGVLNKAWGLSASIGDFNNDDWPDIYVANDYLEPDILYINNHDGTFKNEILDRMNHISFNSMGSDYADINNDMLPDLLVLDMLAEDHQRGKENMASMSTDNFNAMVSVGYHHQYMANVLQINNGNGNYSDIGQLAGINNTDWSWSPLIADFDNDGFKDVFITNGIEKDMGNQDFRRNLQLMNKQNKPMKLDDVLNMIPADKLANYIFKNNGDLTFSNQVKNWGLNKKVNSNGSAYADLDNDGDLDLVVNNENDIASIYKNNSQHNFINVKLTGDKNNKLAIGSKISIETENNKQYQELYLNRGFLSSVSNIVNFGLGKEDHIKSIEIIWPDGKKTIKTNVKVNELIEIDYINARLITSVVAQKNNRALVTQVSPSKLGINYSHEENLFDDFSKQLLLPQKQSTSGPCLSVADVNGDELEDVFIGGAVGQSSTLFLQNQDGSFSNKSKQFLKDKNHEDLGSLFFDADGDNDLDLYIASGGYEFSENDSLLQDRLYINDGKGNFKKSNQLPKMVSSTKSVKPIDFDKDGDLDLVIGGNVIPGKYPLAPKSYILKNQGGSFIDVTNEIAHGFSESGMINDIEITDYNNDGNQDIILVGLWMPITIFKNNEGEFTKEKLPELENIQGWYYSIASSDFDNDGDIDYVIGGLGMNNKFHPSLEKPLHIFSGNFDDNLSYDIALSKAYNGVLVPVRGKECSSQQTPFLNEKIGTYKEFASLNIKDIYGNEIIETSNHLKVHNFRSLYLTNNGSNGFSSSFLPNESQFSATLDFEIIDVNNDGHNDIVGVGNLYDAEVETIRYDASQGYVLFGNGKGEFKNINKTGFSNNKDMRSVNKIVIKGQAYILVANNNDKLNLFKLL
ncbi:MAG: hypothetical protein ACJARX_000109 [Psychroserpens sp.]|jgi:hypothetical protein